MYFPSFIGINLMFNDDLDCCAWGGTTTLSLDGQSRTYRMTWLPPWGYENQGPVAHEMGHGFGLPHSSGPVQRDLRLALGRDERRVGQLSPV